MHSIYFLAKYCPPCTANQHPAISKTKQGNFASPLKVFQYSFFLSFSSFVICLYAIYQPLRTLDSHLQIMMIKRKTVRTPISVLHLRLVLLFFSCYHFELLSQLLPAFVESAPSSCAGTGIRCKMCVCVWLFVCVCVWLFVCVCVCVCVWVFFFFSLISSGCLEASEMPHNASCNQNFIYVYVYVCVCVAWCILTQDTLCGSLALNYSLKQFRHSNSQRQQLTSQWYVCFLFFFSFLFILFFSFAVSRNCNRLVVSDWSIVFVVHSNSARKI